MLSVDNRRHPQHATELTDRAIARVEFLRALTLKTDLIRDLWDSAANSDEAAVARTIPPKASSRFAKMFYTDERFAPARQDAANAWAIRVSNPPPVWLVTVAHDFLWAWAHDLLNSFDRDHRWRDEAIRADLGALDATRFIERTDSADGPPTRRDISLHCGWLVSSRLCNRSSRQIGEDALVSRQAVSSAIASLEKLLELSPDRRRGGRPRKKPAS